MNCCRDGTRGSNIGERGVEKGGFIRLTGDQPGECTGT